MIEIRPQLEGGWIRLREPKRIGFGAYGVVYNVQSRTAAMVPNGGAVAVGRVAVKVALVQTDSACERMQDEARALAGLSHPNIVAFVGFGSCAHTDTELHDLLNKELEPGEEPIEPCIRQDTMFLVMELVEGVTLERLLSAHPGGLDGGVVAHILAEAADALSHAHGRGVIHRDIKLSNILVTRHGHVKVVDFGIAVNATRLFKTRVSAEGERKGVGTKLFAPPAQYDAPMPAEAASDIYSLGVVGYRAACGRSPFASEANWRAAKTEPMARVRDDVSPDLALLVHEMMVYGEGEQPSIEHVRRRAHAESGRGASLELGRLVRAELGEPETAGIQGALDVLSTEQPTRPAVPEPRTRQVRGAWVVLVAVLVGVAALGATAGGDTPADGRSSTAEPQDTISNSRPAAAEAGLRARSPTPPPSVASRSPKPELPRPASAQAASSKRIRSRGGRASAAPVRSEGILLLQFPRGGCVSVDGDPPDERVRFKELRLPVGLHEVRYGPPGCSELNVTKTIRISSKRPVRIHKEYPLPL